MVLSNWEHTCNPIILNWLLECKVGIQSWDNQFVDYTKLWDKSCSV